jgi:hypothetical protein
MAERSPFDDLIDVASRLTALMERENGFLAKHDTAGIKGLQEEKLALTRAYTTRVRELSKDPTRLKALTQVVRDEIKTVMKRFDEVATHNEMALKAARIVNERVLQAIVDAANKQQPRVAGYSRTGAMAKPYGSAARVAQAPPVSVNISS